MGGTAAFRTVEECSSAGREGHMVVADMDGTLLLSRSSFPYFALVAYDVGGPLRLLLLLAVAPLAAALYYLVSEAAGIQVLIFASFAGARVTDIESAARAVLPKFYLEDLHPESWRVFSACGTRCVLTANPRIMVEASLKEYLGVGLVMGTELETYRGRATGLVCRPGVLVGRKKAAALRKQMPDVVPDVGLGDRESDFPFMRLCQEAYVVPRNHELKPVAVDELPKPVIFHDGRLVLRPTPLLALLTVLWIPAGFLLSCLRVAAGSLIPVPYAVLALRALGLRVTTRVTPPPPARTSVGHSGVLFVCSHRTLLDPIILSYALGRPITAVTYSLSRLSEILAPIRTVSLTRNRASDAAMIKRLLEEGDLVICPEGTTCREPYLLRFSALFAELTDQIVPVAMENGMSMFHGTTARGWKGMDAFYFFMNPRPSYEVTFLDKLPPSLTCGGGGKTSHEVANCLQRSIAAALSYRCTGFTRRDKYKALAGNDGSAPEKKDEGNKMGKTIN